MIVIELTTAPTAFAQRGWSMAGHDLWGARHSTLKQMDTKNETKLENVWTYHMNASAPPAAAVALAAGSSEAGEAVEARGRGRGGRGVRGGPARGGSFGRNSEAIPALEPQGDKEIWSYDVTHGGPARRGLESWAGDRQSPPTVFFGTSKRNGTELRSDFRRRGFEYHGKG